MNLSSSLKSNVSVMLDRNLRFPSVLLRMDGRFRNDLKSLVTSNPSDTSELFHEVYTEQLPCDDMGKIELVKQ